MLLYQSQCKPGSMMVTDIMECRVSLVSCPSCRKVSPRQYLGPRTLWEIIMHPHLRFERLDFPLHFSLSDTFKPPRAYRVSRRRLQGFLKGYINYVLRRCGSGATAYPCSTRAMERRATGRMECALQLLSNVPWNFILPAWPAGSGTQDTPPAVRECGLRSPAKSP